MYYWDAAQVIINDAAGGFSSCQKNVLLGLNDGSCGPDSVHVSVVVRRMYYWDSESTQDEDFIDAVSVVVRRMYYWDLITKQR